MFTFLAWFFFFVLYSYFCVPLFIYILKNIYILNQIERAKKKSKNSKNPLSKIKCWGSSFWYNLWYLFVRGNAHFYAILQCVKGREAFVAFIVPHHHYYLSNWNCWCPYPSQSPFFCFVNSSHWINKNKFKSGKEKKTQWMRERESTSFYWVEMTLIKAKVT